MGGKSHFFLHFYFFKTHQVFKLMCPHFCPSSFWPFLNISGFCQIFFVKYFLKIFNKTVLKLWKCRCDYLAFFNLKNLGKREKVKRKEGQKLNAGREAAVDLGAERPGRPNPTRFKKRSSPCRTIHFWCILAPEDPRKDFLKNERFRGRCLNRGEQLRLLDWNIFPFLFTSVFIVVWGRRAIFSPLYRMALFLDYVLGVATTRRASFWKCTTLPLTSHRPKIFRALLHVFSVKFCS